MSVEVKHLAKRFGGKILFEDLSFTVEGPVVLWAPSGWGKTTLLRILMGLENADAGQVSGVGRVSAVFQEDRLCLHLDAVQNVALAMPGGAVRREEIAAGFAQLDLGPEALALPARRLSGGQKRRVALLRALCAEADTLLLDEPFTGMDPATLRRAAALLKARAGHRPVLLATHDRAAIEELGWQVLPLA